MTKYELENRYFKWICDFVYDPKNPMYDKLLSYLFDVDFRYSLPMDGNREADGIDLRYRFGYETGEDQNDISYYLDYKPCSVLEMLVALSIRMETIMDNVDFGNRVGQWFWSFIVNLGLGHYTDSRFDISEVSEIVDRFLDREYAYNGEGGLVTLDNPKQDLRSVEIWYQVMWYLNEVLEESR